MRLIFVSALLPYPLYSGGQIRMYELLKRASKKHEISLFSFIREEREKKYTKNLSFLSDIRMIMRGRAWQARYISKALVSRLPLLMATYDNKIMKEAIDDHVRTRSYDVIHIEPSYVWPALGDIGKPVVVSEHNIEYWVYGQYIKTSPLYLRPFISYDVMKLTKLERSIWHKADHIVAVSKSDKNEIERYEPQIPITVVPNGVDIDKFTYSPSKRKLESETLTCTYIGNFSWIQNRDAVDYLLTSIWKEVVSVYPHARCRIVGKNPPSYLIAKANQSGITIETDVEDIRKVYKESDIIVAPIRVGGGTKYKILEAMASGVPVITTKRGIEGLEVNANDHIWIAEEVSDWIDAIHDIIRKNSRTMIKLQNSRHLIESRYSWDTISHTLEDVWEQAAYEKKAR